MKKCDLCTNVATRHVLLEKDEFNDGIGTGQLCEDCIIKVKSAIVETWTEAEWQECGGEDT